MKLLCQAKANAPTATPANPNHFTTDIRPVVNPVKFEATPSEPNTLKFAHADTSEVTNIITPPVAFISTPVSVNTTPVTATKPVANLATCGCASVNFNTACTTLVTPLTKKSIGFHSDDTISPKAFMFPSEVNPLIA